MAATEPIRDKRQLKRLAEYFRKRGQQRNHVLIILGTYTTLRISDLLRLTWDDVMVDVSMKERLWRATVESVTVLADRTLKFTFRDGSTLLVKIQ